MVSNWWCSWTAWPAASWTWLCPQRRGAWRLNSHRSNNTSYPSSKLFRLSNNSSNNNSSDRSKSEIYCGNLLLKYNLVCFRFLRNTAYQSHQKCVLWDWYFISYLTHFLLVPLINPQTSPKLLPTVLYFAQYLRGGRSHSGALQMTQQGHRLSTVLECCVFEHQRSLVREHEPRCHINDNSTH